MFRKQEILSLLLSSIHMNMLSLTQKYFSILIFSNKIIHK